MKVEWSTVVLVAVLFGGVALCAYFCQKYGLSLVVLGGYAAFAIGLASQAQRLVSKDSKSDADKKDGGS